MNSDRRPFDFGWEELVPGILLSEQAQSPATSQLSRESRDTGDRN
jgi:hypothetical protein